jgi:hypothetical protein
MLDTPFFAECGSRCRQLLVGAGYAITVGAEAFCVFHHVRIGERHVVVLTKLEVHLPFDLPVDAVGPNQYDNGDLFADSGFDLLGLHQCYGRRRGRAGR